MLHDGHMGKQTVHYCSQLWGIPAKSMLKEKCLRCEVCQKHRDVKRVEVVSSLNRFSESGEALGMDYVASIEAKYLLVKIDYLSKLVELDVCEHADSKHTVARIEKWESYRGSC